MIIIHSTLACICVVRLLFVLFSVLFVCKCILPPGDNPTVVNKYIVCITVTYTVLYYHFGSCFCNIHTYIHTYIYTTKNRWWNCVQILINAKLQIGKTGKKTELIRKNTWKNTWGEDPCWTIVPFKNKKKTCICYSEVPDIWHYQTARSPY